MTVKVCPECGAEYVLSTEVCADDGTELVTSEPDEMEAEVSEEVARAEDRDEADLGGAEVDDEPAGEQIVYEFEEWDNQSRVWLDQLLEGEGILHVWEGASLVVRTEDESRVDELVDQVEITNQPTLDADKEQVVYELTGWPDEKRAALATSLDDAEIPFGHDENDDLVVHEEDEERVEAVLDQVDFNFSIDAADIEEDAEEDEAAEAAGEGDETDGLAVQEALSDLFVSADRLMHDAEDHEGVLTLADAARKVEAMSIPYGFAPLVWEEIQTKAVALRELLEATDSEDEAIEATAKDLRDLLRQYV